VNTFALDNIVRNSHASTGALARRASESTERPAAPLPRQKPLDRASWKPSAHKASSTDGHVGGQRAARLSITPRPHAQADACRAMRKATSWIDLNGRSSELLWAAEGAAPAAAKPSRSTPKNGINTAWAVCEGHITMPYLMGAGGSTGDLTDGASAGGHSAPLLPVTSARSKAPAAAASPPFSPKHAASVPVALDARSAETADTESAGGSLPPMRMFTFLRMCPEMLHPGHSGQWLHFMRHMHSR